MIRAVVTPVHTDAQGRATLKPALNRYVFVLKQTPARAVVRDYGRELEFFWDARRKGYFSSDGSDYLSIG